MVHSRVYDIKRIHVVKEDMAILHDIIKEESLQCPKEE
jgi:hypothetical protein